MNSIDSAAATRTERVVPVEQQWFLNFNGINIAVDGGEALHADTFQRLSSQVAGMTVTADRDVADGTLSYRESEEIAVSYLKSDKDLRVVGPRQAFEKGVGLTYAAQYLAECLRASKGGTMLVHAAGVALEAANEGLVLFGEKGAGKTTIALRLCHELGYRLVGNDQIFLGQGHEGIEMQGGSSDFTVRATAILGDDYLGSLFRDFTPNPAKSAWNDKLNLDAETLGIVTEPGPVAVRGLYHVRIDRSQNTIHTRPWEGLQRNLLMHERLGRHISGQATPLLDDSGNYYGSLPAIELAACLETRDKLASAIFSVGITEVFAPDGASAVDYINKQYTA